MSAYDESQGPEGYDVSKVEAWVRENVSDLTPPFKWVRLQGGHSNLTYALTDSEGREAVIRRPPRGELLPKAHDMSREWSIISALGKTPVPVAKAIAFCESPDVTGAWFYIMGKVEGQALYAAEDSEQRVPLSERPKLAHSFIDVLAALHAVDPDEVGLGNLGKKDSYVGRQLRTWYRSWTASVEDAQLDDERAHRLQAFLTENLPVQEPARIAHGDYGLHNCLIGPDCTVAAVVDWEISTLGDPLADLAYALNQWAEPDDELPVRDGAPTSVSGYPRRAELAQRYADETGRDLSKLDYYVGFNWWKSACIVHGVYARYMAGKKSTDGLDLDSFRERIARYLTLSERAIARL